MSSSEAIMIGGTILGVLCGALVNFADNIPLDREYDPESKQFKPI